MPILKLCHVLPPWVICDPLDDRWMRGHDSIVWECSETVVAFIATAPALLDQSCFSISHIEVEHRT